MEENNLFNCIPKRGHYWIIKHSILFYSIHNQMHYSLGSYYPFSWVWYNIRIWCVISTTPTYAFSQGDCNDLAHDPHDPDTKSVCRPRWLSWIRRPTGDQEVAGSTPAEVGNILSRRLIMKYFLRSFSPFRWFKKGSCQFLAKECAQYWLTA